MLDGLAARDAERRRQYALLAVVEGHISRKGRLGDFWRPLLLVKDA